VPVDDAKVVNAISDLHDPDQCRAASEVLARVGDKWSVLIVMVLGEKTLRFSELKRQVGSISQRMLTRTLRGLERDGLISRTVYPTVPLRVDYMLTDLGQSLHGPALVLSSWSMNNYGAIHAARRLYDDR
jgi:DNA-binding HxlR family transcriptional regulator